MPKAKITEKIDVLFLKELKMALKSYLHSFLRNKIPTDDSWKAS